MDENTNTLPEQSGSTVPCLDCETPINLPEDPGVGDVLVCDNCGVELEIIETDPEVEIDYLMIEK